MAKNNIFALFGLPARFAVDLPRLQAAHQAAMKKVHPDLFAARPAAERRVAEQWSTRINEAFQTVRDPIRRSTYLCEQAGHPVNAETNTSMPMDFLMMQIQWREALEAAAGDSEKMQAIDQMTTAQQNEYLHELGEAIDQKADWETAVELTRKLMFVRRFREALKEENQKL